MASGLGLLAVVLWASTVFGQEKPEADHPVKKIPPPEPVSQETKDGMLLRSTFYPGTKGKESIPVILLHMFKGKGDDFKDLPGQLQALGHAVLVPDLRGHGASNMLKVPGKDPRKLQPTDLKRDDFVQIIATDMEMYKEFLRGKNNAGELNLDRICLVGAEMGAVIALNWAAADWRWPDLPTVKQGKDVQGLVLLSPEFARNGVNIKDALAMDDVRRNISLLFVVGSGKPAAVKETERIYNRFKTVHPEAKTPEDRDLFLFRPETALQGTQMLGRNLRVEKAIADFIRYRIENRASQFPWKERKTVGGN